MHPNQPVMWVVVPLGGSSAAAAGPLHASMVDLAPIDRSAASMTYAYNELTPDATKNLPICQSLRVLRIKLGEEITHDNVLMRAQLNGPALKLMIWVDTGHMDSFARIYKTITKRYVRFALLLRNAPCVLIVDCGDVMHVAGTGLAFLVPPAVTSCSGCRCEWSTDEQVPFQHYVVEGWNPLSQDAMGKLDANLKPVEMRLSAPNASTPGAVAWTVRPQCGCHACVSLSLLVCIPLIWPLFPGYCKSGEFPSHARDTWSSFSMNKVTLKGADCWDQLEIFKQ